MDQRRAQGFAFAGPSVAYMCAVPRNALRGYGSRKSAFFHLVV